MTHFISITQRGYGDIHLVGNLRIKEYLLTKTTIKSCDDWFDLLEKVPFWVVEIEKAFQLNLISLNRMTSGGDITTIDMVFDNPKVK